MALESCTIQRSPCVNPPVNPLKQDELAGARSNAGSNEAPTLLKALTPPLVLPPSENLFTKFIKVFMKTMQTQAQVLAELRKRSLKARTTKTYWGKSHMDCYHFCQQYKAYFEISGTTGANCTPFAASFLRGSFSLRLAQHKRRYKSVTPITWSEFKSFLQKDLGSFQAFIDSIWSKFRRDSQY